MLRRSNIGLVQGLRGINGHAVNVGGTIETGAICQTCGRLTDEEVLLDDYPSQYPRVLVRHHGSEEMQRFDMGSVYWVDKEDWHKQLDAFLRNATWFRPETAANHELRAGRSVPDYEPTAEGKIFGGIIGPDGNVVVPAGPAKEPPRYLDVVVPANKGAA